MELAHFYQDKEHVSLQQMVAVDVNREDYYDVSYTAQIRAILKILPLTKTASLILTIVGLALIIVISLVSITHVWEIIASIKPTTVEALSLDASTLHSAALVFTVVFDIALVYLLFVNLLASFAGTSKSNVYPLFALLGILNALFVFKYFPGLDTTFRSITSGTLTYTSVFLLPIVFILTIAKLKAGVEYSLASYVALSIKQETLTAVLNTALVSSRTNTEQGENISEVERAILALADTGMKVSAIAKVLGGNYQKRLEQVKTILESQKNNLVHSQATFSGMVK